MHRGEGVDFSVNTTAHLIRDIERLRVHLGVARWLIYGASWGSTLRLVYAEAYPERVRAIVLAGVTTTRRSEIDWLYRGMAPLLPAQWERSAPVFRPAPRIEISLPPMAICCSIPILRYEPRRRAIFMIGTRQGCQPIPMPSARRAGLIRPMSSPARGSLRIISGMARGWKRERCSRARRHCRAYQA
jgi:pimeloyl-ACP methyl ester carboxylesterase